MGRGSSALTRSGAVDEMSQKGYVGLSGEESDAFMDKYHNKNLIHEFNTMTGAEARRINGAFRNGEVPADPADKALADRLDKAIASNELPQDMTLFRGVPLSAFAGTGVFDGYKAKEVSTDSYKRSDGTIDFDAWGKAFTAANKVNERELRKRSKGLVGKEIIDDGFLHVSASSQRNIFLFDDVNLQIRAKKGTHAYISRYKSESEIILGRSTKLRIVGTSFATVKTRGAEKRVLQVIADVGE